MPRDAIAEAPATTITPEGVLPESGAYDAADATENPDTAPVSQMDKDAAALGYTPSAGSDVNAVQDMLEQSLRNELKATKAFNKWKNEQGPKGRALLADCTEHRQRTSRLYHVLTAGVDGITAE